MRKEIKREQDSVTCHVTERKRRQNFAKCCSVSFQSWMNQWNCSDVNEVAQVLGKNLLINYWLWNVLRVWFFWKHRCNHRSKQIEAVRFYHISCGSWTEQVCTPFAQRRHHVSKCACLIELKTELKTENLNMAISVQLGNKITVVRKVRIHHLTLLNAKHKTHSQCGRNGKNNSQTTSKGIQLLLHGIRFV